MGKDWYLVYTPWVSWVISSELPHLQNKSIFTSRQMSLMCSTCLIQNLSLYAMDFEPLVAHQSVGITMYEQYPLLRFQVQVHNQIVQNSSNINNYAVYSSLFNPRRFDLWKVHKLFLLLLYALSIASSFYCLTANDSNTHQGFCAGALGPPFVSSSSLYR